MRNPLLLGQQNKKFNMFKMLLKPNKKLKKFILRQKIEKGKQIDAMRYQRVFILEKIWKREQEVKALLGKVGVYSSPQDLVFEINKHLNSLERIMDESNQTNCNYLT